jgi:CRP/FNR family transcriptional regulator, cyclic AMP receptor protein
VGIAIGVDLRTRGVKVAPQRPWHHSTRLKTQSDQASAFDLQIMSEPATAGCKVLEYGSMKTIFSQGDPATTVLYIREGGVKLAVVDSAGKEAVLAILGPGDFVGEGCLTGQTHRASTATAITRSTIVVIDKLKMIQALHERHEFSDQFITYMLARHIRDEESLADQIFNFGEKRLARTLVFLSRYFQKSTPKEIIPEISQEILAEMIGATRSQVNRFMNKFRRLGFIDYAGSLRGLQINKSLRQIVLQG